MGLPEFEMPRGSTRNLLIGAAAAVILLAIFLYLWNGGVTPTTTGPNLPGSTENGLQAAVQILAKDKKDLNTCRAALARINSEEARKSKDHPANLDEKAKQQWRQQVEEAQKQFDLDAAQVTEIEGRSYTLLDAHHLDQCFLLRDAARALEGDQPGKPLERARDAFDWVVRQVRLQEAHPLAVPDKPERYAARPLPPQFALRRGWGSALDRAFVFLALLEQLPDAHLCGCLLAWPRSGELPEVWACGVLVENDPNVYLFDPRLGLPLPGPNGRGIATLAAARNDPAVLEQLTFRPVKNRSSGLGAGPSFGPAVDWIIAHPKYPYDVTAKRAQEAEIYQYFPLSALAPRMAFLQTKLLAPANVQVRLAADVAADGQKLRAAAQALGDKPPAVKAFPRGLDLLRGYLPKEEGGLDEGIFDGKTYVQWYTMDLVSWNQLPPPFNEQNALPRGLEQRITGVFAAPFLRFQEPEQARDLMLRGDYRNAIELLSKERQTSLDQRRLFDSMVQNDSKWQQKFRDWVARAQLVYADYLRAKNDPAKQQAVEDIWKDPGAQVVATYLNYAISYPRGEQTTYYLALCKHELAEQAQRRSNEPAKDEWDDALFWWNRFAEDYRDAPEAEAARRLHGRALAQLGQRDQAIKVWEAEVKNGNYKLEAAACLYLAAQLQKK